MRILIANDDGIYSPGIAALAKMVKKFGDVKLMAPDAERSSTGHAVTHSRPISYKRANLNLTDIDAYRVNGTPADCVALGTHLFATTDVVLSGINLGPNLGNSMWHSGTLAAAKQAVLLGIKGIALSVNIDKGDPDFDAIEPFVAEVLMYLLKDDRLALYNVNFPQHPVGIRWTKQSVRLYDGRIVPGIDPMGRKHYWFTVTPLEPAEEGTDRWAIENDYVSVTPLSLDITNTAELEKAIKNKPW